MNITIALISTQDKSCISMFKKLNLLNYIYDKRQDCAKISYKNLENCHLVSGSIESFRSLGTAFDIA